MGIRKWAYILYFTFCQFLQLILYTECIKKGLIERYSEQFRPQQYIGVALCLFRKHEKSYILCKLYIRQSAIHTVHYTNTRTNSLPPKTDRSVWHIPLVPEDSWTNLLTCSVQHFRADYRLLTAGLLWFWSLTRPALCCIVQVYTDMVRQRGETCW